MHGAPSVSYPVGRSAFAVVAMGAAWFLGVAGIALWSMQSQPAMARVALAIGVAALAGAIALRAWLRAPGGTLSWDGHGWSWAGASGSEAGTPDVALDVQRVLLLRWHAANRVRWLWLEKARLPARWDDLRRAVYSRAP